MNAVKVAFPPSVAPNATLLILGSLPGDASLAAGQYYAKPTNQFWRLLGGVIGVDLGAIAYPDRLAKLAIVGIGLWDVLRNATRPGSSDGAIRDHEVNDLASFAARLPKLRGIAFNGGKAATIGRQQLNNVGLTLIDLPSSSAAYCAIPFAAKQERWLPLRRFIGSEAA